MKFFLDTANLNELKQAKSLGILNGVTTNPSLISKEKLCSKNEMIQHYVNICNLLDNGSDLSVEVTSTNYKDIIKEGESLSKIDKKIIVKVPMTCDGLKAINFFYKNNIKTNCTLVFSLGQALLAAKLGATYVSPFIGRLDDISFDGIELINKIYKVYNNYRFNTKILAASIRNPIQISKCAEIGIYAVTSPLQIITFLIDHPLTKTGLDKFLSDYRKKYII